MLTHKNQINLLIAAAILKHFIKLGNIGAIWGGLKNLGHIILKCYIINSSLPFNIFNTPKSKVEVAPMIDMFIYGILVFEIRQK